MVTCIQSAAERQRAALAYRAIRTGLGERQRAKGGFYFRSPGGR